MVNKGDNIDEKVVKKSNFNLKKSKFFFLSTMSYKTFSKSVKTK